MARLQSISAPQLPLDGALGFEELSPPPGLSMLREGANSYQWAPGSVSDEIDALARENQRLQEERALLLRAKLAQENAILAQENAYLQMQMQAQAYAPRFPHQVADFAQMPASLPHEQANRRSSKQSNPVAPGIKWKEEAELGNALSFVSTAAGSSDAGDVSLDKDQPWNSTSFCSEDGAMDRTTIMMRNIPNNYTRTMLLDLINAEGFQGVYDLVYLPIDFNSNAGFGYAFINLVTPEDAERFRLHFQGYTGWALTSEKVCDVMWSGVHQGLEAHIERYRNSPVMHPSVPDDYKPVVFKDGVRVQFPPPTKLPRAPRIRRRQQS